VESLGFFGEVMDWSKLWDSFSTWAIKAGMPSVAAYHFICSSIFLNTAAEDAKGIEWVANQALAPFQYLCAGHVAVKEGDGYVLKQRFTYEENFFLKTTGSVVALPVSLTVGSLLKGIAYCSGESRTRHDAILAHQNSTRVISNLATYATQGIPTPSYEEMELLEPQGYKRRPGEEFNLALEKELLKEVARVFKKHNILYWLDCGSCLGAYRYGGVIPWDEDIDVATLLPDFENVRCALNELDKEKYTVQDWSSRDLPKTYLRIHVRRTPIMLDIYSFNVDPDRQLVQYILSNENSPFLVESWKIRERRFTVATPFDVVFPLKKARFDGIEVLMPNKPKEYLQLRYGENINPAKIYSEISGEYEKDMSHPYWQRAHVH
jgi:phosphorylcholine metabolism protein LicD